MARGKRRGKKRNKKHFKKNSKLKLKQQELTFRDIKHTHQYDEYRKTLMKENEKIEKGIVAEEETEPEPAVEDPFNLLLSTFKNRKNFTSDNAAIDSEDSSEEGTDLEDVEIEEKNLNKTSIRKEENGFEFMEEKVSSSDEDDEEIEIDVDSNNIIEENEINNKEDPFHIHLGYDLDESLVENVSTQPMKVKTSQLYWPVLKNLKVEIPISEKKEPEVNKLAMDIETEYAKEYNPPTLIKKVDLSKLHVKSQIHSNVYEANKKHAEVQKGLSNLQKEIFSIINNYQDLYYPERNLKNGEEIRFIYCLHAVNHVIKSNMKILHHNNKLLKNPKTQVPDHYRDQGLVKPKVLIIVPFRDSCLRIVNMICSIFMMEKGNVVHKKRFFENYSGCELQMPKKNPKPEDYELLFKGNTDDNFRIGLCFTKKSIKLYADFYSSDIIIASPLGLRMIIGAEGDKNRDYDFLASTELLILDQAEVFLMQNWDHLLLIFEHLHVQPKESHGIDFSRIRSWALNGWAKFYRQTLIFSSISTSELNAVFNRRCFNYAGKIRVTNPVEDGSICHVIVLLSHIFQKFQADTATNAVEARFKLFTEKIITQFKDPAMSGVLIYVPSYFDYVRIRNYLNKEDYTFVQICEYSKDAKVARARDMFFHKEARLLLYSERFHFFRRITLKGIRHIVFYQPPTFPHFYSELCNLMQEGNQNRFLSSDSLMTVTVLYCKYDILQLSAIVKTSRAVEMISSEKSVHMFSTS